MQYLRILFFFLVLFVTNAAIGQISNIVTFASNAYTTPKSSADTIELITTQGLMPWSDKSRIIKVYFYVAKPTTATFSLNVKNVVAKSILSAKLDNGKATKIKSSIGTLTLPIATYTLKDTGYHFIEIRGVIGTTFPLLESLLIDKCEDGTILFNKSNYRGAASTHLRYTVPGDSAVKWFYTEVRVPDEVKNSVNAYYETNGFHSGYGGIQINNPKERRFIFSIWSLFKTDDPKQIPLDYIVHLNKKGNHVFTGDFGDEGSGGHSHLVYPWSTNKTYRFLTGITSLKGDSATYIGYFAAPDDNYTWHLLSQWTQHKTDTKTGFKHLYAFVENFGDNGDDYFKAYYSNQWAITYNGTWMELTEAKFTTTANNKTHQRFDYGAGVDDGQFYMYSGGFKKLKNIKAGDVITRPAVGKHVTIDFESLPGVKD
jgi:hypothetical protein